ncbi:MAG TPA: hypothetical protein PKL78_01960 [Anaerolineales bacterium]|nr:hypothetical protein [Anaerolineales bacterium]HNN12293.1 hypothetical protein [Anaerolineales bacterium]HNO30682.1 hypothetical protein [Anaerolineales bacterium]
MEALGINAGLLLTQLLVVIFLLAFPIATLVDLGRKRLTGTPLAIWALIICVIPVLGSLAYWIIKPAAESR